MLVGLGYLVRALSRWTYGLGPAGPEMAAQLMSGVVDLLMAGVLLTAGVGWLRLRRWARDIAFVASWVVLLRLLTAVPNWVFSMEALSGFRGALQVVAVETGLPFYLRVMTGALAAVGTLAALVGYFTPSVYMPFEGDDSQWTDTHGLPLFGLSLFFIAGSPAISDAVSHAYGAFYPPAAPFPPIPVLVTVYAVCFLVAIGVYRQYVWAWGAAVAVTFGWAAVLVWRLVGAGSLGAWVSGFPTLLMLVVVIGYELWAVRYFPRE